MRHVSNKVVKRKAKMPSSLLVTAVHPSLPQAYWKANTHPLDGGDIPPSPRSPGSQDPLKLVDTVFTDGHKSLPSLNHMGPLFPPSPLWQRSSSLKASPPKPGKRRGTDALPQESKDLSQHCQPTVKWNWQQEHLVVSPSIQLPNSQDPSRSSGGGCVLTHFPP